MKVAVISDIHGFSLALDRLLADIDKEPGVDSIVAAGDLCEGGPDPLGVRHILDERGIRCIQGNTDRDLADASRMSAPASWVMDQLGEDGLAWLGALPFDLRISPPNGIPEIDDLLVVHANPFDQNQAMAPWLSEDQVRELLGDTRAAVIAFGHIHIAYTREVDGVQLIDVSAVGNPKDEDMRSKWGLCNWDATLRRWSTELRYVEYPIAETFEQMERSGMPKWLKAARKLKHASYQEMD